MILFDASFHGSCVKLFFFVRESMFTLHKSDQAVSEGSEGSVCQQDFSTSTSGVCDWQQNLRTQEQLLLKQSHFEDLNSLSCKLLLCSRLRSGSYSKLLRPYSPSLRSLSLSVSDIHSLWKMLHV